MNTRVSLARSVDKLDHLRRFVPERRLPSMVARRIDRLWEHDDYRLQQEGQMRYLLEHTERADEVPTLARGFAAHALLRTYRRWHPEGLRSQDVRGVEWLTTRRDASRGLVLSFMHHNWYEGLFASLQRHGADITILTSPKILAADASTGFKQHARVVTSGGVVLPATGGTDAIQARLRPGVVMAIASDVPGHTEVKFLGRRVLASFGAALMAMRTDSPVVLATNRRDGESAHIQVHEPIDPRDFTDPLTLLTEILDRHAEAILAWPEVLEMPRARWGIVED